MQSQHWSDEMWKSTMAGGGGNKKRFQYCTDPSGQDFFYLRALQGHSGRNPIDLSLQDNVLTPNDFFEYIFHIGCAINLHSIMNSGLIPGGQNLSKRQTVFFTSVDQMNKERKDLGEINLNPPRLAWYKQKTWRNIKTRCIGSTSILLKRKDDLSSIRHDRTQSSFTTRSQLIVSRRLSCWELEKSFTRKYMLHLDLFQRFPWNMTGWKIWVQKLLEVVKTPNKPNNGPKKQLLEQGDLFWHSNHPVCECSGNRKTCLPWLRKHQWKNRVICFQLCASVCWTFRSRQRRSRNRRRRTCRNAETRWKWTIHRFVHAARGNRHWLHSVWIASCSCETSRNFSVRELVKKIESHPHRQALQADLKQNNTYKPFSDVWKAVIREMGHVELFELCETIP